MEYKIKIFYYTGDSFGSHDEEEYLDGIWQNENVVRENLKRIKEHYLWYKWENSPYFERASSPRPLWHTEDVPKRSVKLLTDSNVEYTISAFWCGYFEELYGAKAAPFLKEFEFTI